MSAELPLLIQVLRRNKQLTSLSATDWDLLIRQAKRSQIVAKLYYLAANQSLLDQLPVAVFRHLQTAKVTADKQTRDFLWEVEKLKAVFANLEQPLLFLKGAAYAVANLPAHQGRLFSDMDLLVPFSAIDSVEKQLLIHGWISSKQTAYDQRYYRQWMHEIPPLTHVKRGSVVDLHHNILPRTAVACPNPLLLLEAAEKVPGVEGVKILGALDRVIHSATHLFYDGELEHGLRDLLDLDCLLTALNADSKRQLVKRAIELGLQQPVYYALRYLQRLLDTPDLDEALQLLTKAGCEHHLILVLDALFMRALMPDHRSCNDAWTGFARWLLYIRSHYLRMPLKLLIPHLSRKAWLRLVDKDTD